MCSLWQRFGRAGRGVGREATAILLVNRSHFDHARETKRLNTEARKRKVIDDGGQPEKRSAIIGSSRVARAVTQQPRLNDNLAGTAGSTQEERAREYERNDTYNRRTLAKAAPKKGRKKTDAVELYGPVDDLVNAKERGEFSCRREPVKRYFGGSIKPASACEFIYPLTNNVLNADQHSQRPLLMR